MSSSLRFFDLRVSFLYEDVRVSRDAIRLACGRVLAECKECPRLQCRHLYRFTRIALHTSTSLIEVPNTGLPISSCASAS